MLSSRKPVVTGMSSHPEVRCLLPFVQPAQTRAEGRSVHHLTITFRATAQIPHIAGGPYGREFRAT